MFTASSSDGDLQGNDTTTQMHNPLFEEENQNLPVRTFKNWNDKG